MFDERQFDSDGTPEISGRSPGEELTRKIAEMVAVRPKLHGNSEGEVRGLQEHVSSQEVVDQIMTEPEWTAAYHDKDTDSVVYLDMPPPGSNKELDLFTPQWRCDIKVPIGAARGIEVVRNYNVEIGGDDFSVSLRMKNLFYDDDTGALIKRGGLSDRIGRIIWDADAFSQILGMALMTVEEEKKEETEIRVFELREKIQYGDELAAFELAGILINEKDIPDEEYENYHPQIMEILNSFKAEDIAKQYDPENGHGIFF